MKTQIKNNLVLLKKNWQIIYAIILIILVPTFIVINTISIIKSFEDNIDILLQRQALGLAEVYNGAVLDKLDSQEELQKTLTQIGQLNPDIQFANILIPESDREEFKIIASLQNENINKTSSAYTNILAWFQERSVAQLTTAAIISQGDPLATRSFENLQERFWDITIPLVDENGNKKALLNLKMSLNVVDAQVEQTIINSAIVLVISIIIVIALLSANTRLFQYAVLAKKLKEVEQLKDEFISMASHELRTPITSLRGYLSLLADGSLGELPKLAQEKVLMMLTSSERLADLVEDLLNVSRIEQGRLEIAFDKVDLTQTINQVMAELSVQAEQKNLKFEYEQPRHPLPPMLLDEKRMKQVLINIIGNSIKYTPKGSVSITTKLLNDGEDLEIRVADTGMGMTQKEREKLFQKFYRVKSNSASGIKGTGLGLWITYQLIKLMKGDIEVDSIKGVGTQMAMTFPVLSEQKIDDILKKQEEKIKEEAKGSRPDTPKNPYPAKEEEQ